MASFQAAIQIFHNKRHGLLSLLDNFAALSGSQLLPIGYTYGREAIISAQALRSRRKFGMIEKTQQGARPSDVRRPLRRTLRRSAADSDS